MYKYPRISNTLKIKKYGEEEFLVSDFLSDEEVYMSHDAIDFAKKLDGHTNPFRIRCNLSMEEKEELLEILDEHEFLMYSKVTKGGPGTFYRALWYPKSTIGLRIFSSVFNLLLMLSWLPMLILGISLFAKNIIRMEFNGFVFGFVIGLILGTALHELGHLFAGFAYNAPVYEVGVMLMRFVIPGAYVMADTDNIKNRNSRIQIDAAGIEMNLLLAGVSLLLGSHFVRFGGMFMMIAIMNILFATLNLTFIEGLDGSNILSNLFGEENIVRYAKSLMFNKNKRKKLTAQGIHGYAFVVICYILVLFQIAYPAILAVNILEVIACF